MALTAKDRADIAALIAEAFAQAQAPVPTGAPAQPVAASPLVVARKGKRIAATRADALARKLPGRYCDGHGTHDAHGFAFAKLACPTDKLPL